jgi:hypothetical protein
VKLARGFGLLSAVLSQQEYRPWDGAEEHGEGGEGMEKEKGKEAEVHTDGENGGQKETEAEGRMEQERKESETEEVIIVEGGSGSEDGVGEETMDAE